MLESFVITIFPIVFLGVLFGGGEFFRRRSIDQGGDAPITKTLFIASKYSIVVLWGAAVAHSWGLDLSIVKGPEPLRWFSLCLWAAGFVLLFLGRFGLGSSFRLGSPREGTRLQTDGLFRFSRNPMYLGVYTTLLAAVLYTLNPIVLILAIFVVVVHHRIVLAEEQYLRGVFGDEYADYCLRVRRYL
jgi:protein-S-isoprenylcysteine O-methyltransferase Ste14